MGRWSYATLVPREQSVADALAEGEFWSPDYYQSWLNRRHAQEPGTAGQGSGRTGDPFEAAYIRALILGEVPRKGDEVCRIDGTGARFRNATITGELNLTATEFGKPLIFENCHFDGDVILDDAKLGHVAFKSCTLEKRVQAENVRIDSEFLLEDTTCLALCFDSAHIEGSVSLERSRLLGDPDDPYSRTANFTDAKIGGHISIRWLNVTGEVRLVGAKISSSVLCNGAQLTARGASRRALYCCFATIGGGVYICEGFRADGDVILMSAIIGAGIHGEMASFNGMVNLAVSTVGGSLFFSGATFEGRDDKDDQDEKEAVRRALYCWNSTIGANVFLRKATVSGEVNFDMAKIGGSFRAENASFLNPGGRAVNCSGVTIEVSVFLRHVTAQGPVDFYLAKIGGRFVCTGAQFDIAGYRKNDLQRVLNCDAATIGGSVMLDGDDGRDDNDDDGAGGTKVPAAMRPFMAKGAVYFHGATIGGDFDCRRGLFVNMGAASLVGSSAKIDGNVYFRESFVSIGEIYFRAATIGGNLHCRGGSFHDGLPKNASERDNRIRDALDLEGVRISKALYLTGIRKFKGSIDLQDAHVGIFADDLSVWNRKWNAPRPTPPDTEPWLPAAVSEQHSLDEAVLAPKKLKRKTTSLRGAEVRTGFSYIQLDRFHFDAFGDDDRLSDHDGWPDKEDGKATDLDARARFALLERQKAECLAGDFRSHPFTHCAQVLRSMGRMKDARLLLYEREKHWLKHHSITRSERWSRGILFGWTAGYGYRNRWALRPLVVLWVVSAVLFSAVNSLHLMRTTSDQFLISKEYQKHQTVPRDAEPIHPWLYALDVMLPIINLGEKYRWVPADGDIVMPVLEKSQVKLPIVLPQPLMILLAWLPKALYWLEIFSGWFFTTIIVAGLAGLIGHQHED